MKAEVDHARAPLRGLPLWALGRTADLLWVQFGIRRRVRPHLATASDAIREREVGQYALHSTEFWRFFEPYVDSPHFEVGTFGIKHA